MLVSNIFRLYRRLSINLRSKAGLPACGSSQTRPPSQVSLSGMLDAAIRIRRWVRWGISPHSLFSRQQAGTF